jgi:hypothetical protein
MSGAEVKRKFGKNVEDEKKLFYVIINYREIAV